MKISIHSTLLSSGGNSTESIIANAHLGDIKVFDTWTIPLPNAGVPGMGSSGITSSKPLRLRKPLLKPGHLVMLYTGDKNIPFHVAKILQLFVDDKKLGTWMRIKWLTNGKKNGFLQTYRDIRYKEKDTMVENMLLTPATNFSNPVLIHWTPSADPTTKYEPKPLLTKGYRLTVPALKIAFHDIRLIPLGFQDVIKTHSKVSFD